MSKNHENSNDKYSAYIPYSFTAEQKLMGILSKVYINIWRGEIDYEYLFFNGYATYDHMHVIFNFALSTHLIVDTGCSIFT